MGLSSDDRPQLTLNVQPGLITAIFSIIFDFILLAILDSALARASSHFYYKSIFKGNPLSLKSADVPCVTSFLLGNFWTVPNVFLALVKIAMLVFILNVDIEVDSENVRPKTVVNVGSRLGFNISREDTKGEIDFGAGYLWQFVTNCREKSNDTITFYALAYNVSYGKTTAPLHDPNGNFIPTESIYCLSPKYVASDSVRPLVVVKGCSPMSDGGCTANSQTIFTKRRPGPDDSYTADLKGLLGNPDFTVEVNEVENFVGFSNYATVRLFCVNVHLGLREPPTSYLEPRDTCLVFANVSNGYLVEHWLYENPEFRRYYPGVVFEKDPKIGPAQAISTVFALQKGNVNYETLSKYLVGYSSYHISENQTITILRDARTVSTIPVYTLVIMGVIIVVCLGSYLIVAIFLAKDKRPQLNAINGLSSIAREENQPTGRSLNMGNGIMVGLILRHPNAGRLVPVQRGYQVVSKNEVDNIV